MVRENAGEILEVDCDLNPTDLYTSICALDWKRALRALEKNPIESRIWVVKRDPCSDKDSDVVRFLPLHSACARQPPLDLIIKLLSLYSDASSIVDDNGMYPLHYACANQASAEVIELLLVHYPEANSHRVEMNGSLPIHLSAQWGVSSPVVMKLLLNQNTSLACARDSDDLSPLELAIHADDYEYKEEVVEILRRYYEKEVQYDGDDSTISTQFSSYGNNHKDSSRNMVEVLEKMKNEIIELHQRRSKLKTTVESQIQREWEAVNLTLQQMKLQMAEMQAAKSATVRASSADSSSNHDKSNRTTDGSNNEVIADDDKTADSTTSGVSNVVEEAATKDKIGEKSEAGLQKLTKRLSSKFNNKTWLPNWRRIDRRESKSLEDDSPDYDRYAHPLDDDKRGEEKGQGNPQHHILETPPSESYDEVNPFIDDVDLLNLSRHLDEKRDPIPCAENLADGQDQPQSRNEESNRESNSGVENGEVTIDPLEQGHHEEKTNVKNEMIQLEDDRERKQKEIKLAELEVKTRDIQQQNMCLERELGHLNRRRKAYATKVHAVEGTVSQLSNELQRAVKFQNDTIERIQAFEKQFFDTSAMRRKYLKLLLRDVDNDQRMQGRMAGCENLLKREMKAVRVMEQ
eukprot:CAMPEP_0176494138 /NCGR_PEP_ID=MMETSP0200_2-20121128/9924_1 /TAXON_ID=947934 /ORGANISM="Chaetoceros sp., Strain GSL56" /LENGTH=631 /DNA_ID=CAMNT_0017891851 /DNA_START=47 /DNA_END=1939 /DNA_ORIENTATION=+